MLSAAKLTFSLRVNTYIVRFGMNGWIGGVKKHTFGASSDRETAYNQSFTIQSGGIRPSPCDVLKAKLHYAWGRSLPEAEVATTLQKNHQQWNGWTALRRKGPPPLRPVPPPFIALHHFHAKTLAVTPKLLWLRGGVSPVLRLVRPTAANLPRGPQPSR